MLLRTWHAKASFIRCLVLFRVLPVHIISQIEIKILKIKSWFLHTHSSCLYKNSYRAFQPFFLLRLKLRYGELTGEKQPKAVRDSDFTFLAQNAKDFHSLHNSLQRDLVVMCNGKFVLFSYCSVSLVSFFELYSYKTFRSNC